MEKIRNKAKILLLITTSLLSGCGLGVYSYEHTSSDGASCKVSVWSLRELKGASLGVDKNCKMSGKADAVKGNYELAKALSALVGAVK